MSKRHAKSGAECHSLLNLWYQWDQNETTRKEIEGLSHEHKEAELHQRLCSRMEFGTAGLRGEMKAGFAYMNDLVIIQTTQGLVKYLMKSVPNAKEMGVVVGFDGRHNSSRWARIVANILIRQNIKAYLFSKVCPTPFVPYTVLKKKCACGIMVTASHNPKWDNGYKVYWSNGAQIKSPVDKGIASAIEENLEPWPGSWDLSQLDDSPLHHDPLAEAMQTYYEDMQHLNASSVLADVPVTSYPKFVYTPVHGVGLPYAEAAFAAFGIPPFIAVSEQAQPDGEFPTVRYPNPEEGPDTLNLSFKTADANGARVVIANDPDADRFAVAEKLPKSDKWRIFTGNQLGALLGYWCWVVFKKKNPNFKASNAFMLHSTVSTKMLQSIGKVEGFNVEETLTGFKWMGNRADELLKEPENAVVFAFEEAIGFMCGTKVLDKDGISAAAVGAQMIAYAYTKYGSLSGFLDFLFAEYDYHFSINSYFLCHDPDTIRAVFERLRYYNNSAAANDPTSNPNYSYPEKCAEYEIAGIRDLTVGYDNCMPNNTPVLPVSSSTQMITFTFTNGATVTLRTSGTEPKIKYYTEMAGKRGQGQDEVEKLLASVVRAVVDEFLQPDKFGLQWRSDDAAKK